MIQRHRLRQIREQLALSQGTLGKLVGKDAQYISKLERGVRLSVHTTTLARLVSALPVSADYLLGFSDCETLPRRRGTGTPEGRKRQTAARHRNGSTSSSVHARHRPRRQTRPRVPSPRTARWLWQRVTSQRHTSVRGCARTATRRCNIWSTDRGLPVLPVATPSRGDDKPTRHTCPPAQKLSCICMRGHVSGGDFPANHSSDREDGVLLRKKFFIKLSWGIRRNSLALVLHQNGLRKAYCPW